MAALISFDEVLLSAQLFFSPHHPNCYNFDQTMNLFLGVQKKMNFQSLCLKQNLLLIILNWNER